MDRTAKMNIDKSNSADKDSIAMPSDATSLLYLFSTPSKSNNKSIQPTQQDMKIENVAASNNENTIDNNIPSGATELMGLFSLENSLRSPNGNNQISMSQNKTDGIKNKNGKVKKTINWSDSVRNKHSMTPDAVIDEKSSLLFNSNQKENTSDYSKSPLYDMFNMPPGKTSTAVLDNIDNIREEEFETMFMPPEFRMNSFNNYANSNYNLPPPPPPPPPPPLNRKFTIHNYTNMIKNICSLSLIRTTIIGSFTFTLYHCVFCLAYASSISRPSKYSADNTNSMYSILGPMTKMGALGPILIAPLLIPILGTENPALYPSIDLFLAPFASHMAKNIDDSLYVQGVEDEDDGIFLATFSALMGVGLLLSASLCILASGVKLANFGAFLPYPVLCGFFSAVGLLLWALAINVDTHGLKLGEVMSGDLSILWNRFLAHHLPSFMIGTAMYILRQRNSMYLIVMILLSIFGTYFVMFVTGTSLETAQEHEWFWTADSFTVNQQHGLSPPAPFGIFGSISKINFQALLAGLKTACAMAFIYALRCSILAPALRKNTAVLKALNEDEEKTIEKPSTIKHRRGSESSVDSFYVELTSSTSNNLAQSSISAPKKKGSDLYVLLCLGCGQIFSAVSGCFACVPSTGAAITMYKLGAGGKAPQFGSVLVLLYFYLSDFQLVSYIPKMVFSSLLINTFLDLTVIYFYRSYHKTKQKWEWVVGVPMIVIFSYMFGMLLSIAIGVGLSTIIFVASFYRTGVVKFVGNGLTVRSTIERIGKQALWLDENGDLIQILVLQNYLFFGNASSCKHYIESMFEEPEVQLDFPLPPIPKFIVLDFAIVTGIDTSTVDVFNEIIEMCNSNDCAVYMSGLTPTIKSVLAFGGVKPGAGKSKTSKKLFFFSNMELALGKAEDQLIKEVYMIKEKDEEQSVYRTRKRLMSQDDDGFLYALQQVDEQHGISFADSLGDLRNFTTPIELEPGDNLFESGIEGKGPERGLFFIEFGTMKVERDPTYTISRSISNISLRKVDFLSHKKEGGSIGNFNARTPSIGKELAMLKGMAAKSQTQRATHSFRLASFGPGWVVGMTEGCSGMRNPGLYFAVTRCRLHHLPYDTIEKIEKKKPSLILQLFKMLSHLNARRQDLTIEQLSILHAINSSRAPTKPLSRSHMAAVHKAMAVQGFVSG